MTKNIDAGEIARLAALARVEINDEQASRYAKSLTSILAYIDEVLSFDTGDIQAMSHTNATTNVLREDVLGEHLSVEAVLKNAPDKLGNFIRTPIVVSEE